MRTCRCGNQVARNAKACPRCGCRFTSGLVKLLAVFIVAAATIGIIGAIIGAASSGNGSSAQPGPSAAEQAMKQKDDAKFQFGVEGAKQLRDSMRNPDSFKMTKALIMEDGAVCYSYRSQNGFGGMNDGQAVLAPRGKFKSDESAGFVTLWNKECANKTATDKTWEIGYAAGFHGLSDGN